MTPSKAIISRLLEVNEGDERNMDFYLTGLIQPFLQPYADLENNKEVYLAISGSEVKSLIKSILEQNFRHIEMKILSQR